MWQMKQLLLLEVKVNFLYYFYINIDILRKYPSEYKEIIQVINNSLENITEAESKVNK